MPSKSKKNSKSSASKASPHSDRTSPFSSTSSSLNKNAADDDDAELLLLRSLEELSMKYPSLIGTSALICRLTEDAAVGRSELKGCKIWLSEASMVASSISPGSIVSVSLASSTKEFSAHFLRSSLGENCARHYGFNDEEIDEVGNYFVLATVFPSCKVLKNGVRLSSNLLGAMGYPTSGSTVIVYPVDYQLKLDLVNGNEILSSSAPNLFSIYKCKDLYLSLVSSKSGFRAKSNTAPHTELCNGQVTNAKMSSPKTPMLPRSKFSSPLCTELTSPRNMESLSNSFDLDQSASDPFDIREVLEDEVGKKLLQTCTLSLLCRRHLLYGNLVVIPILSKSFIFKVIDADKVRQNSIIENTEESRDLFLQHPDRANHLNHAILVDHGTQVHLFSSASSVLEASDKTCLGLESDDLKDNIAVDSPKLGGLAKEYSVLKNIIISSSVKGTLSTMGLRPTKGVLLHGPPGTGKTSLARLCAHEAGVTLFSVNGPEVVSQFYGESEQALHKIFDSASKAGPAVVFIDELDAIAPSRKEGGEELSHRMVATLLDLMDGISRTDGLLVIAATSRPDSIESALRRPGRFDREIEIGVPSPSQRHDILLALLKERGHTLSEMEIHHLAMTTHGFVGADLAALCNEAAFVCLRRCIDKIPCEESLCYQSSLSFSGHSEDKMKASSSSEVSKDNFSGGNLDFSSSCISELHLRSFESCREGNILNVSLQDFEKARMKVRPSAMREVILEVPKVGWADVGGQEEVKMQLMEAVEWPQKHQDAFKRIGTRPPTGVLLFGPPGCSKTLLARAVASEAKLNFLAVKGPELFSKWVGESEKAVRSLFAKARANAPSIIFFDELDGLANIRGKENDGVSVADRVMSQLLVELDGLHQRVDVTIIGATNRPDKIDSALLRPGRFDRLVYVGPPNENDRKEIFCVHLRKMPCSSNVSIEELALLSEGCTGADISQICREAAVAAIEEKLDASEVTMEHLKSAMERVRPSDLESYEELSAKFQRLVSSAASRDDLVSKPCLRRFSWISFRSIVKSIALCISQLPASLS